MTDVSLMVADVHLAAAISAYFLPHALLALGVSAVLALVARRMFVLRLRGVRVSGVCVRHTYARDGVAEVAKFQAASGETFRCLAAPKAAASARVGDPMEVVYDPRNPKNAKVLPVSYGGAYALSVISLIVAVPGIWLLIRIFGT
ncbi:DUF3592 domain-containing protein [Streptomyces sp. NPDC012600]|uniref:DUF3592 domain-containing protein n=2 Tax=Streptomyces TaxID=1883 RepID=A0ABU2VZD5_9ACTN|nr:DUF3592 domain-containing protein [Streptomyces griseus]MDT0490645.1 DUF3592 domain-containing protein [Streptomyces griseus]